MKEKYLYGMSVIYLIVAICMIIIGSRYLFLNGLSDWITPTIVTAILIAMNVVYFNVPERVEKYFKFIIGVYILWLIILISAFTMNVPVYTYKEAVSVIEVTTGEAVLKKRETNGINYLIFTEDNLYLFDLERGDFFKSSRKINAK